jgi:hypothetical protein
MRNTMVSFMRSCKKVLDYIRKLFLALCLCTVATSACAEGISLIKTEMRAVENGYEIGADYKIILPAVVEEALKHGVVLNFVSELMITRSRWYWSDAQVIETVQNTKLSYNALTRQYRISRGTLFQGFQNLDSALRVLGYQTIVLLPASEVEKGIGYVAQWINFEKSFTAIAHMRLDITQLPKPLQVSALTNSEWILDSAPYRWAVDLSGRLPRVSP